MVDRLLLPEAGRVFDHSFLPNEQVGWSEYDGRAEGRVVGRVEGEYRLLKRQLERRFDLLPAWVTEKLSKFVCLG
jgi:hypothetical protein